MDYCWYLTTIFFKKLQQDLRIYYILDLLEIVGSVFNNNLETFRLTQSVPIVNHLVHISCNPFSLVRRQYQNLTNFHSHFISILIGFEQSNYRAKSIVLFVVDKEVSPEWTGLDRCCCLDKKW